MTKRQDITNLIVGMKDKDSSVCWDALYKMAQIGFDVSKYKDFRAGLIAGLQDKDNNVRKTVLNAISWLGPVLAPYKDIRAGLVAGLQHESYGVREAALWAVNQVGLQQDLGCIRKLRKKSKLEKFMESK